MHAYRAWRCSEETVVFAATTYAKRYGGQLWERSWSVTENRKTRVIATQYRGEEWSLVICHESYRVCLLFLRRGGVISCMGTGLEIVQNRHGN